MVEVHLRPVTTENVAACLALRVLDEQTGFVASTGKSLAEAKVNQALMPLAVYDVAARGWETPPVPMVGFAMTEVTAGIGFILRVLIDREAQGQGYGRATVAELIRRLRLQPDVELIATSHRRENVAASRLFAGYGFQPWEIAWARENPDEQFLVLPE